MRRNPLNDALPGYKYCIRCGLVKLLNEFGVSRRRKDGRTTYCRMCMNNYSRFGITREDYQIMYNAQGGVCAICHRSETGTRLLAVDHDHKTGTIRGLLCRECNRMLGYGKDSVWIFSSAVKYLKRSKTTNN